MSSGTSDTPALTPAEEAERDFAYRPSTLEEQRACVELYRSGLVSLASVLETFDTKLDPKKQP